VETKKTTNVKKEKPVPYKTIDKPPFRVPVTTKKKKEVVKKAPITVEPVAPVLTVVEKKFRKIAICGTAESLPMAPYDDKEWEVWSISCALTYPAFRRWDRLYELHDRDYWTQTDVLKRINDAKCDIWMQDVYPEVPRSKRYPLLEVSEGYSKNFTNSIVYMIAHAIYEKVNHIALFGVHMAAEEEYGYQRPACEYWLGIAQASGISIHVQGPSAILKNNYLYGYDKEWKIKRDLTNRLDALKQGEKQLSDQLEQVKQNYYQQQGAIKDVDFIIKLIQ
jgi:hypothetical protein